MLRFATLGVQHFWLDEAVTVGLLRLDVADMLRTIPASESTPPLYYLVARAWAVPFGTGEIGLRSLSALAGTLTIPVMYGVGVTLASRRAGLTAAALTAVSPALVWYSQEARSYSLAILLVAVSLLFAARAVTGARDRDVAWWALAAGLALATHYFALFLVAGEAVWLLVAYPRRRTAAIGVAAVGVCGAALLPLALHQSGQHNLDFIGQTALGTRLVDTAQVFLGGPPGERLDVALAVLAVAAAVAALGVPRAAPGERRSALVLAAIGLAGILAAALLAVVGADYLLSRNLLPLWPPLAVAAAVGLAAHRDAWIAWVTVTALAAASLWCVVAVPLDRSLQREAFTAQLTGTGLDAESQRVDPHVAFVRGDAGGTITARALCEDGYTVDHRATRRLGGDGTVLMAYAVCVRPR